MRVCLMIMWVEDEGFARLHWKIQFPLMSRFASKPKKGVKFLQEKQLLSSEPVDVARLFHNDTRLNRAAVGDYLGEGDE